MSQRTDKRYTILKILHNFTELLENISQFYRATGKHYTINTIIQVKTQFQRNAYM